MDIMTPEQNIDNLNQEIRLLKREIAELQNKYLKTLKPKTSDITGLTAGEKEAMSKLLECYGSFLKLERTHPSELSDFVYAVHLIQGLLCKRVIRRVRPQGGIPDNGK